MVFDPSFVNVQTIHVEQKADFCVLLQGVGPVSAGLTSDLGSRGGLVGV